MGKLHNPGPGEIADRLSILELKIQHGRGAGKDVGHFLTEQETLVNILPHQSPTQVPVDPILLIRLTVINYSLWQAEDRLRDYRKRIDERRHHGGPSAEYLANVAEIAIGIQDLNDQRARVVAAINAQAGISSGPEKL